MTRPKYSRSRPRFTRPKFTRPKYSRVGQAHSAISVELGQSDPGKAHSDSAISLVLGHDHSARPLVLGHEDSAKHSQIRPKGTRPCCFSYLIRPFDSDSAHSDSAISLVLGHDDSARPLVLGHDDSASLFGLGHLSRTWPKWSSSSASPTRPG